MNNKILTVALVVIALLVSGLYFKGGSNLLGGGTRMPSGLSADSTSPVAGEVRGTTLNITSSAKISSTGTSVTRINTGTCYILAYAATIAASTTAQVDCQGTAAIYNLNTSLATALTGVTFGDFVVGNLSTTTAASGGTSMGIIVNGVSASTTAGYITVRLTNLSGTTFTWPTTGSATGTMSYIVTK